jgi:hypothetical protein
MVVESPSPLVCPITNSEAPPPPTPLEIATAAAAKVDVEGVRDISESLNLSEEGDGVNLNVTMPSQQSTDTPGKPPPRKKAK